MPKWTSIEHTMKFLTKVNALELICNKKDLLFSSQKKFVTIKILYFSFYIQRICFDSEIQRFIHHKELASDLRLIKKNVFNGLEEFILQRYSLFLEEEKLHRDYKKKVEEIEKKFSKRFEDLMNEAKKH